MNQTQHHQSHQETASDMIWVPGTTLFTGSYLTAPSLWRLAAQVKPKYRELTHLSHCPIAYAWRKKGGTIQGQARLARCEKVPELTRFLLENELMAEVMHIPIFLISFSADHLFGYEGLGGYMSGEFAHRLMYHELSRIAYDEERHVWKLRHPQWAQEDI